MRIVNLYVLRLCQARGSGAETTYIVSSTVDFNTISLSFFLHISLLFWYLADLEGFVLFYYYFVFKRFY